MSRTVFMVNPSLEPHDTGNILYNQMEE
jgi:hypothetical protein